LRRRFFAALACGLAGAIGLVWPFAALQAQTAGSPEALRLRDGDIVLIRHALAPGTGDPAEFRLNDCSTQRNLDAQGRIQAQKIGAQLQRQGIPVQAVWTSQWCRTRDTARLAFSLPAKDMPAFNSFFENASNGPAMTEQARAALLGWSGPGLLVVVTHQVNITALTGVYPSSGEGVAVRREGAQLQVLGRITAP